MTDAAHIAELRRHAEDCRKQAAETKLFDLKQQWEKMARDYDELADKA